MAKAIGIGGVFLDFKGDLQQVMNWYEKHLKLDMTPYGTGFTEGAQFVLLSFKRSGEENEPLLNIRVDDCDEMIKQLKAEGVQIITEVTEYPYGKFARFIDPFGNPIELWEVYEKAYKEMVQSEVKAYKDKK
jgi:predicted enzyme related to lactoylglutathione lyase